MLSDESDARRKQMLRDKVCYSAVVLVYGLVI